MLDAMKYASPICGRSVANMWCTHNPSAMNPFAICASTIAVYPTSCRRECATTIADTNPSAGMKMMYTSGCQKNQKMC
jgi:hypothetical protein